MTKLQRKRATRRLYGGRHLILGYHVRAETRWYLENVADLRSAYHCKLPRWLYSVPLFMFCQPKSIAQSARRMLRGVPGWDERGRKL